MANYSKTVTCSNNSKYSLRLELKETSQNVTTNTSKLTYALYIDTTYNRFENYNVTYAINVTKSSGTSVINVNTTANKSMPTTRGESLLLVSGTTNAITHDSDGSLALKVSFSMSTATSASYLPGTASFSNGTFNLDNLDRAEPTITASITDITHNSFKINATSDCECNQWYYSLNGDSWVNIANTSTTSVEYTVSGLAENYSYTVQILATRASNGVNGTSEFLSAKTLIDQIKIYVKRNGVWKVGRLFAKRNGQYSKVKELYVKRNGVWVKYSNDI